MCKKVRNVPRPLVCESAGTHEYIRTAGFWRCFSICPGAPKQSLEASPTIPEISSWVPHSLQNKLWTCNVSKTKKVCSFINHFGLWYWRNSTCKISKLLNYFKTCFVFSCKSKWMKRKKRRLKNSIVFQRKRRGEIPKKKGWGYLARNRDPKFWRRTLDSDSLSGDFDVQVGPK